MSALLCFLCASVLHFGEADAATKVGPARSYGWLEVFVRGGLILRPLAAAPGDCSRIFQVLADDTQGMVMQQLAPLRTLHTLALVWLLWRHWRALEQTHSAVLVAELCTLLLCFALLPPLLSFVLYFNLYHGARHVLRVMSTMQLKSQLRGPAVATLLPCAAGFAYVAQAAAPSLAVDHTLRAVFIGLAALTAPHMILVGTLVHKKQL